MLAKELEGMKEEVEEIVKEALETYPTGLPSPLGPLVLVKLLLPNQNLKNSQFKTLENKLGRDGKKGFQTTSEEQIDREKKGGDIAIVIEFGPGAYKKTGRGVYNKPSDWGVKVGDIVQLRAKYMGKEIQNDETDKTGHLYRLVYDDEIIGIYKPED